MEKSPYQAAIREVRFYAANIDCQVWSPGWLKPADFDVATSGKGSTAAVGRVQFYARTRPLADSQRGVGNYRNAAIPDVMIGTA